MRKTGIRKNPIQLRIARRVAKEEIGLGDMISRATTAMGFKPCAGCKKRAAALNEKVVFGGAKKK